jgi:hypothetical protein
MSERSAYSDYLLYSDDTEEPTDVYASEAEAEPSSLYSPIEATKLTSSDDDSDDNDTGEKKLPHKLPRSQDAEKAVALFSQSFIYFSPNARSVRVGV